MATLREPDAPDWLSSAAGLLTALMPPGASCWIMDAELGADPRPWTARAMGLSGFVGDEEQRLMRDSVKRGLEADRSLGSVSRTFGVPNELCMARRQLIPDSEWQSSAYHGLCKQLGAHDFARCVLSLSASASPRRWMVLEVQGLDAGWRATPEILAVLDAVGPGVAIAYRERFIRLEELREAITMRVSAAGRPVLPLLAEGLTETDISRKIHRSVHTVHDHVKQIYRSLRVSSRRELRDLWTGIREFDAEPARPGRPITGPRVGVTSASR